MRDRSANYHWDWIILEWWCEAFLEETKKGFVRKVKWKATTFPWELETWESRASYDWWNHPLVVRLRREKTQQAAAHALAKKEKKEATLVGKIEKGKRSSSTSGIVVTTGLDVIGARIFQSLNQ